jgi:hypothetical protein
VHLAEGILELLPNASRNVEASVFVLCEIAVLHRLSLTKR